MEFLQFTVDDLRDLVSMLHPKRFSPPYSRVLHSVMWNLYTSMSHNPLEVDSSIQDPMGFVTPLTIRTIGFWARLDDWMGYRAWHAEWCDRVLPKERVLREIQQWISRHVWLDVYYSDYNWYVLEQGRFLKLVRMGPGINLDLVTEGTGYWYRDEGVELLDHITFLAESIQHVKPPLSKSLRVNKSRLKVLSLLESSLQINPVAHDIYPVKGGVLHPDLRLASCYPEYHVLHNEYFAVQPRAEFEDWVLRNMTPEGAAVLAGLCRRCLHSTSNVNITVVQGEVNVSTITLLVVLGKVLGDRYQKVELGNLLEGHEYTRDASRLVVVTTRIEDADDLELLHRRYANVGINFLVIVEDHNKKVRRLVEKRMKDVVKVIKLANPPVGKYTDAMPGSLLGWVVDTYTTKPLTEQ